MTTSNTKKDVLSRTQARLDRLKKKTYKDVVPHLFGQKFSYVFGYTKAGKVVCLGPFTDSREADSTLETLEDGEIFELDTRDLGRATRVIKAELLQRTGDPDESIKRMLHQKGLEREETRKK